MKVILSKIIYFGLLVYLIALCPQKIYALQHEWVEVPKSQFGRQLWDKKSIKDNEDSSIEVYSRFIPKNKASITKDILYTMNINCDEKTFKDVAIGRRGFNGDLQWKDPNGDKLIMGVINQVCAFKGR
ncbi:hypothetical protein [Prochlorococcus sp. MIT 1341]|uniref:hypothetical protein n=1 Tax=Prochlorococcus sp. MIT 1341 TaxID=3096221 RepID=UPI002A74FF4A|nr:hypothetical protein [Prochlorococcus sp. MIT 1341]